METIEWRDIPSIPTFQVSDTGLVRRKGYFVTNKGRSHYKVGGTVKQHENDGYLFVRIHDRKTFSKDGKAKAAQYYVHILVAEAFIGPNPDPTKFTVDHKDRNRQNNTLGNLKYATKQEQSDNRTLNPKRGSDNKLSKLTDSQVLVIKDRLKNGEKPKEIAPDFNVSPSCISSIDKGKTWKHINNAQ